MTKAEELEALVRFIASLPVDSYLRPWLEQELPTIENSMRMDMPLEHACHGFAELREIAARLTKREAVVTERERTNALLGQQLHDHTAARAKQLAEYARHMRNMAAQVDAWAAAP